MVFTALCKYPPPQCILGMGRVCVKPARRVADALCTAGGLAHGAVRLAKSLGRGSSAPQDSRIQDSFSACCLTLGKSFSVVRLDLLLRKMWVLTSALQNSENETGV